MSYTSSALAAIAVKLAFLESIKTALADAGKIDISFGLRWPAVNNDAVGVTSVDSNPEDPEAGSGRRARYDNITLGLSLESWVPGGDADSELKATTRVYEIFGIIDTYLRSGNNISLGGACEWILLQGHKSDGITTEDEDGTGRGRLAVIDASFTANARISN